MLTWIAFSFACSVVLALAAWCAEVALPRAVPRRAIWSMAIIASLVMPALASSVRSRQPVIDRTAGPGDARPTAQRRHERDPQAGGASPIRSTTLIGDAVAKGESMANDRWVLAGWAAASTLAAAWFLIVHIGIRRRLRQCRRVNIDGQAILASDDFGPAVVGVFRGAIVVPAWCVTLGDRDRALVIAHEAEHLRARDPLLLFSGLCVAIAQAWNVAVWWQLSRLQLAIEIDCDRRVLKRHGESPRRYGLLLLDARSRGVAFAYAGLALAQRHSALAARIDAMMTTGRQSFVRASVAGVSAIALLALTAFSPAPPLPSMPFPVANVVLEGPVAATNQASIVASDPPVTTEASAAVNPVPSTGSAASRNRPTRRLLASEPLPRPQLTLSRPAVSVVIPAAKPMAVPPIRGGAGGRATMSARPVGVAAGIITAAPPRDSVRSGGRGGGAFGRVRPDSMPPQR